MELPQNGSKIQAFSFVEARIIRARSGSGFWVGCFPQDFSHFAIAGRLHRLVVEIIRNFFAFSSPQNKFRRMSEKTARKVRRWIRLCPGDTVQNAEVQLVQHLRNRKNVVVSARNPDCAFVLQMRAAGRKPFSVEAVILFKTLRFVPVALIHAHLFPGLDRDYRQGVSLTLFGPGYSWLRTHFVLPPFLRFASERLRRYYYS